MNERRSLHQSQSKVICWNFFRIMAAKTLEKSVSLTDSDVQTYLEGKENQNTERKTESYVFSSFGNGISTTEIFATGRLIWHCFVTSSFLRLSPFPISHCGSVHWKIRFGIPYNRKGKYWCPSIFAIYLEVNHKKNNIFEQKIEVGRNSSTSMCHCRCPSSRN